GLGLVLLGVNQRQRTRFASIVLVLTLPVIGTGAAAIAGGMHAPATTYYLTIVFIAGLLLDQRWSLITALLCCLGGLVLVYAERQVVLPANEVRYSAFGLWVGIVINMAIIIGLQYLAAHTARNAFQQVSAELAERQRTESALRESEQRYREVFEKTSDCIFLFDVTADGRFRVARFNPAEEKSVGVTNTQAVGKFMGEFLPKKVAEEVNGNFQRCVEAGVPIRYEEELDLPVGRRFFDTALIPVRDGTGRICRLVGIAHNITERKQAAEGLQRSTEQLRALSSRLQTLREEERTRIAREIHDHLGQFLTALKLELHSARSKVLLISEAEVRTTLINKMATATELINELISSVQKLSFELRPGTLDRLGLEAAIESEAESFQSRTGIQCEWSLPTVPLALPAEHATAVFRIFQEVLTNVARHARATRVVVCLNRGEDCLELQAEDNGIGIKESDVANPKALGLLGMQERAAILGGTVTFRGNSKEGTTVTVQIPLDATREQNS
ncbi:MAG: putative Histidine kinase, partial [Pedosphaera sp.]|nr:putative Histidine kinase [Pedosphaera sp.]